MVKSPRLALALGAVFVVACGSKTALESSPSAGGGAGPAPEAGNVTSATAACASFYKASITPPSIAPSGPVEADTSSIVRLSDTNGEDVVFMEVNGVRRAGRGRDTSVTLVRGRNVVDVVVMGEGNVHAWNVALFVDGKAVFRHDQRRLLPSFECSDELFRYRIVIDVE